MGIDKINSIQTSNIGKSILPVSNVSGVGNNILSTSDSYTKLLLHMNNAGGTFYDHSSDYKTVTAYVNATQSSAQKKFGTASALFDGNSYVKLPVSDDWNFGTGAFTFDFWIWFNSISLETSNFSPSNQYIFDIGSNQSFLHWYKGYFLVQNPSPTAMLSYAYTPTINTWIHIALSRSGNNWYFFINGNLDVTASNTAAFGGASRSLTVGNYGGGGLYGIDGYIDEFRVSKGIARWTSNFSVPTSSY